MYPKINGLFKRFIKGPNKGKFIEGAWSLAEFELLKDILWQWTEKLDGCNMRINIYRHPLIADNIEILGRTDKAIVNPKLKEKMLSMIDKEKVFKIFPHTEEEPDVVIYGEGLSHKINNGGKYFKETEGKGYNFIVFDIKIGNLWLSRDDVENICKELKLPVVPVVGEGTILEALEIIKKGLKSTYGNFVSEGIVCRPVIELKNKRSHRIITKIKTKDFINREEDR